MAFRRPTSGKGMMAMTTACALPSAVLVRTTPSLGEAIESCAKLMPAPLSQELDLALNEYHLGAPLDVALKTMSTRLKSRTMNVALGTLRIARNTGGNLPDTLEISAAALAEDGGHDGRRGRQHVDDDCHRRGEQQRRDHEVEACRDVHGFRCPRSGSCAST